MDLFSPEYANVVSEITIKKQILADHNRKYATLLERQRATVRHHLYSQTYLNKYRMPWAITMDDVRIICDIESVPGKTTNNKYGAFFSGSPDFAWTGEQHVSRTKGGHGNLIKIWTLSPAKFMAKFGRIPGGAVFAPGVLEAYQNRRAS